MSFGAQPYWAPKNSLLCLVMKTTTVYLKCYRKKIRYQLRITNYNMNKLTQLDSVQIEEVIIHFIVNVASEQSLYGRKTIPENVIFCLISLFCVVVGSYLVVTNLLVKALGVPDSFHVFTVLFNIMSTACSRTENNQF